MSGNTAKAPGNLQAATAPACPKPRKKRSDAGVARGPREKAADLAVRVSRLVYWRTIHGYKRAVTPELQADLDSAAPAVEAWRRAAAEEAAARRTREAAERREWREVKEAEAAAQARANGEVPDDETACVSDGPEDVFGLGGIEAVDDLDDATAVVADLDGEDVGSGGRRRVTRPGRPVGRAGVGGERVGAKRPLPRGKREDRRGTRKRRQAQRRDRFGTGGEADGATDTRA